MGSPIEGREWKPKAPWHNKFVRVLRVERWQIVARFQWYRGLGNPTFNFIFQIGRPPKLLPEDWLIYEEPDDE